jgi:hypothetical protein
VLKLVGVQYQNVGVMLLGTGVGGTGFGTVFFETLRSALPYAQPGERAGLLSAYFVEGYLSFSLPALAAGFLAPIVGLTRTADFYGIGSHPAGNHSPAITLCRAGAHGQLQRWSTDGPSGEPPRPPPEQECPKCSEAAPLCPEGWRHHNWRVRSRLDDANAKAANGSRTRVGCFRASSLSNG